MAEQNSRDCADAANNEETQPAEVAWVNGSAGDSMPDETAEGATAAPVGGVARRVTWEEKLTKAKEFKSAGNGEYKAKNYKTAIGKYHRALLYLKGILDGQQTNILPVGVPDPAGEASRKPPEDVLQEVLQLRADCYNNLAACILQTDRPTYEKVVTYCENVLEHVPNNTKALYRLGVSLYHLRHIERALASLKKAQKLPGGDTDNNIKRYISMCERGMVQQEEQMKKTYKTMFARMAQDNSDENMERTSTKHSRTQSLPDAAAVTADNIDYVKEETMTDTNEHGEASRQDVQTEEHSDSKTEPPSS